MGRSRVVSRSSAPVRLLGVAILFGALVGGASAFGVSSFAPAVNYPVGREPSMVASGDLNGDLEIDLVVADSDLPAGTGGDVSILLGNGDGTFADAVPLPIDHPQFLALGDLDNDGDLDLVVTQLSAGGVSVLVGNGDGTFGPPVALSNTLALGVAIADVNGDGAADLAVASYASGGVTVLLGRGDGTFEPGQLYPANARPFAVAFGDIDRDGLLDLAVTNLSDDETEANDVSILLGDGHGAFGPPTSYSTGRRAGGLALADLNADSILDLVVGNTISRDVSVLLGHSDGTFAAAVTYPTSQPALLAVADLNSDLRPDIVVATGTSGVSVLRGLGDGTFAPAVSYATPGSSVSVAPADFNRDGKPDLAVAVAFPDVVSVLLNTSTNDSEAPTTTIALTPPTPTGLGGWYTGAVGVSINALDNNGGSDVAETRCALDPPTPPTTFAELPVGACSLSSVGTDGQHTIYAASTDGEGNAESPVSARVSVDATPPVLNPSVSPSPLYLNASATASPGASDPGGSGLASSSCGAVTAATVGDHTVTCTATDNAGNSRSVTLHYPVEYRVLGFFSPLPGSKLKPGQTVPVKIALADVNGVRLSNTEAAALLAPVCQVVFSVQGVQAVGPTCMKYDLQTKQFTSSWKLAKTPTGQATLAVTVSYPGTSTTTTLWESVTIGTT